jgi:hypothetical protein
LPWSHRNSYEMTAGPHGQPGLSYSRRQTCSLWLAGWSRLSAWYMRTVVLMLE